MGISYDFNKKTAKQHLTTISTYELDGEFQKVLDHLQEKFLEMKRCYQHQEMRMTETFCYGGKGAYCDGDMVKHVKFDTFYLDYSSHSEYGDDPIINVYGERKMLPEEIEAMEKTSNKEKVEQEQRDKNDFERLKKQYGW